MTLSVAESCTGGMVSDRITNVPGSSDYFEGGIVSYSIQAKAEHLHIPRKYIERHGAVSSQVAKRMAEGVRKTFNTTLGLSTTGVAGPTGGTRKTPVGTVFIGFSREGGALVKKLRLKGTRREIKKAAAEKSLQFLFEQIVQSIQNPESRSQKSDSDRGGENWAEELRQSKESIIVLVRKARLGISNQKGRLGIFPASFNPPTLAHVALIREAIKRGRLDEVLVLLDIQAMDKEPVEAKFEDRLTMLKKVFGRDPRFSIGLSNRGLFLEKLNPLRKYYPSPVQFFFIVGFDTILRVMDKRYYRNRKRSLDEMFNECRFLVANREDQEERVFDRLFRGRANMRYRDRVSFFDFPKKFSFLSSSFIRKRISEGKPVDDLIPASILRFIDETDLYTEKG